MLFLLKSANYLIKLNIAIELKSYWPIEDRLKNLKGAQAPWPHPSKSVPGGYCVGADLEGWGRGGFQTFFACDYYLRKLMGLWIF